MAKRGKTETERLHTFSTKTTTTYYKHKAKREPLEFTSTQVPHHRLFFHTLDTTHRTHYLCLGMREFCVCYLELEPSNEITKLPFMKMSGICLCKCHCAVTTHAMKFFTCVNKFMKLAEYKRQIFCLFRAHSNLEMCTTAQMMKEDEFCWAGKSSCIKISGQYGICPFTMAVACF